MSISWLVDMLGGYPLFSRDSSEAERRDCSAEGLGRTSQVPAPKLLSGHQPTYLPGIILFNKIALSDAFMFCGDFQYRAGSWHSHNFIRGHNGMQKLTVPVNGEFGAAINEMRIYQSHWRKKHLDTIRQIYGKRPYFDLYYPALRGLIGCYHFSLASLNESLINQILEWLEIKTPTYRSERFTLERTNNDRLIEMCHAVGATGYLSSPGEAAYIDKNKFEICRLSHSYQSFKHPIYDQGNREFITNLSVIDLLFNCGPDSGRIVRGAGHAS